MNAPRPPFLQVEFNRQVGAVLGSFQGHDARLVRLIAEGRASHEQVARLSVFFAHFVAVTPREQSLLHARGEALARSTGSAAPPWPPAGPVGGPSQVALAIEFVTRFAGLECAPVAASALPPAVQSLNRFRLRVAREEPVGTARAVLGLAGGADLSRLCAVVSAGLRRHYGVRDEDLLGWTLHVTGLPGQPRPEPVTDQRSAVLLRAVEDPRRCLQLMFEYQDHWRAFFEVALAPERSQPPPAPRAEARSCLF